MVGARLPLKPVFGLPCNGCGMCCVTEFDAGRFVCGMIRRPGHSVQLPDWGDAHLGALFAEALRAGKGCDADDVEL